MKVKCLAVKRGIFSDRAKLYSENGDHVIYDSLLGRRKFYIKAGLSVTVKVPKKWMVHEGEERDFDDWITSNNAWDLPWCWHY